MYWTNKNRLETSIIIIIYRSQLIESIHFSVKLKILNFIFALEQVIISVTFFWQYAFNNLVQKGRSCYKAKSLEMKLLFLHWVSKISKDLEYCCKFIYLLLIMVSHVLISSWPERSISTTSVPARFHILKVWVRANYACCLNKLFCQKGICGTNPLKLSRRKTLLMQQ